MDGNGEEERGGTFSSKKVDWKQEPGSPRGKRERDRRKQEDKLHQVTRHSGPSVVGIPSPCLPLPKTVTNSRALRRKGTIFPQYLTEEALPIKEVPCLCPFSLPNQVVIPQQRSPYLSRRSPTPQAGRQAGRQGWERTPGPSHLFTPPATSAILTYNNYDDDGTDRSQHDHHLAVFPPILPL